MGLVRFGMPLREVLFLQETMGLNVFVEGGTFAGETAINAKNYFDLVFTIENSDQMYEVARKKLSGIDRVVLLKGDTREHIADITREYDNLLFWLDSHWCGGDSYGEADECPLIAELDIIFRFRKRCAILIDDARLFCAPPPKPHVLESWPTLKDIVKTMPVDWELIEYEDVIYILPKEIELAFRALVQDSVTEKWITRNKKKSLVVRALKKLGIDVQT